MSLVITERICSTYKAKILFRLVSWDLWTQYVVHNNALKISHFASSHLFSIYYVYTNKSNIILTNTYSASKLIFAARTYQLFLH